MRRRRIYRCEMGVAGAFYGLEGDLYVYYGPIGYVMIMVMSI